MIKYSHSSPHSWYFKDDAYPDDRVCLTFNKAEYSFFLIRSDNVAYYAHEIKDYINAVPHEQYLKDILLGNETALYIREQGLK